MTLILVFSNLSESHILVSFIIQQTENTRLRLIVFLLTAVTQTVVAVTCFFLLLVGLNGYSERHATTSLIFYIVFSFITIPGISFIAGLATKYFLDKKGMGKGIASLVGIITSSILGAVVVVGGMFVAFVIAEIQRGLR